MKFIFLFLITFHLFIAPAFAGGPNCSIILQGSKGDRTLWSSSIPAGSEISVLFDKNFKLLKAGEPNEVRDLMQRRELNGTLVSFDIHEDLLMPYHSIFAIDVHGGSVLTSTLREATGAIPLSLNYALSSWNWEYLEMTCK